LSARRQKCRRPVLRSVRRIASMIGQYNERRQVVVRRTNSVADPPSSLPCYSRRWS
jgi:hypothetical protein